MFIKNGARTYVAANITGRADHRDASPTAPRSTVPAGKTVTTGAYTWSGGNAAGGTGADPTPTADARPRPRPADADPDADRPTPPPATSAATRYLPTRRRGCPGDRPGSGGHDVTLAAANGNHDGTPDQPAGVHRDRAQRRPTPAAQTGVRPVRSTPAPRSATAAQVRVSYDLTGNGSWDRVETYRYFATDPVAGYEHYTQAAGLRPRHRHAGRPGRRHGQGRGLERRSATTPTTLGIGNQSVMRLPFS